MALSYLLRQGWKDAFALVSVTSFLSLVLMIGGGL